MMDKVPEHLDLPVQWEWPLCVAGATLVIVGYVLHPLWLGDCAMLLGAGAIAWSRILGTVKAQRSFKISRAELARGEREYLWQALYRWIRNKKQ
jgi:hypothetical protein